MKLKSLRKRKVGRLGKFKFGLFEDPVKPAPPPSYDPFGDILEDEAIKTPSKKGTSTSKPTRSSTPSTQTQTPTTENKGLLQVKAGEDVEQKGDHIHHASSFENGDDIARSRQLANNPLEYIDANRSQVSSKGDEPGIPISELQSEAARRDSFDSDISREVIIDSNAEEITISRGQKLDGQGGAVAFSVIDNKDMAKILVLRESSSRMSGTFVPKDRSSFKSSMITDEMLSSAVKTSFGSEWANFPPSKQALIILYSKNQLSNESNAPANRLEQLNTLYRMQGGQLPRDLQTATAAYRARSRNIPKGNIELTEAEATQSSNNPKRVVQSYVEQLETDVNENDAWDFAYNIHYSDLPTGYEYLHDQLNPEAGTIVASSAQETIEDIFLEGDKEAQVILQGPEVFTDFQEQESKKIKARDTLVTDTAKGIVTGQAITEARSAHETASNSLQADSDSEELTATEAKLKEELDSLTAEHGAESATFESLYKQAELLEQVVEQDESILAAQELQTEFSSLSEQAESYQSLLDSIPENDNGETIPKDQWNPDFSQDIQIAETRFNAALQAFRISGKDTSELNKLLDNDDTEILHILSDSKSRKPHETVMTENVDQAEHEKQKLLAEVEGLEESGGLQAQLESISTQSQDIIDTRSQLATAARQGNDRAIRNIIYKDDKKQGREMVQLAGYGKELKKENKKSVAFQETLTDATSTMDTVQKTVTKPFELVSGTLTAFNNIKTAAATLFGTDEESNVSKTIDKFVKVQKDRSTRMFASYGAGKTTDRLGDLSKSLLASSAGEKTGAAKALADKSAKGQKERSETRNFDGTFDSSEDEAQKAQARFQNSQADNELLKKQRDELKQKKYV